MLLWLNVSLLFDPLPTCTEDEKLIYSQRSYILGKAHYLTLGWWKRWSQKHCNCSCKSKPTSSRSRSSWSNWAKLGRSQRESLISRVVRPSRLQSADCFVPQPSWMAAECVDVYFMRYILHDWNDEYCIKILKNLLQSGKLKKGGWIVLAESVIPPPGIASHLPKTITKTFGDWTRKC